MLEFILRSSFWVVAPVGGGFKLGALVTFRPLMLIELGGRLQLYQEVSLSWIVVMSLLL